MNLFRFFTKTVGRKISLGYVLAVVLTLIIGASSYISIGKLNETAELVDHTYLVLGQLEKITSSLIDAETGQRGFLITHVDTYLEPYNHASAAVDEAIAAVRDLTSDNPRQQARLDHLKPLVEAKRTELQETIDLRRDEGFEAAQAVVLTDKGKAVMDDIRDLIGEMSDEEEALLVERDADAQATSRRSIFTILLVTTLSMLFLTSISFFTVRGIVAPVRELVDKSQRVAQGDLTARADILSTDEIGTLTRAFNTMVAQLQEAQTKIVRQTRLAALGQIAPSIAHDLRNPLAAVLNAATFLGRRVPENQPKWNKHVGIIKREVGTAARIINNLMEMSRGKEPKKQAVDLLQAVREIYARLPVADGIDLTCRTAPEPFEIYADPSQFQQVVDNLVTNAIQAMEGRGEITVEAVRDNRFDEITVRDEGPGITEQEREQIFELLYSTRARGTGLGLTISRQIIERHGGTLELAEAQEPGAVFRIRLPRREVTDEAI